MRIASIPRLSWSAAATLEPDAANALALVMRRSPGGFDPRGVLRSLVGRWTGRPPESIRFETSAAGKPGLPGCSIAFNLSHARSYSLVALSQAGDVGCDVEDRFGDEDVLGLGAGVLHACELDALARLAPHERPGAFRRYWVRKEAVLKAAGTGFLRDPRLVVTALDQSRAAWVAEEAPPFFIHDIQVDGGCVAAVASMDTGCRWHLLAD